MDILHASHSSVSQFSGLRLSLSYTSFALNIVLRRYDFGEAGRLLYEFVWSDFADWYIEAAKARLYGEDVEAAAQVSAGRWWQYNVGV